MQRDIAEAYRVALGKEASHRVVVLVDRPETALPLVAVGARLAVSKAATDLLLSLRVPFQPGRQLELGAGLGGELLTMTQTMAQLRQLTTDVPGSVHTEVRSRFSNDVAGELPGYLAA